MRQYHLRTTPSLRKKRRKKKTGPVFEKLDTTAFVNSNKIPSYEIPAGRGTDHIPSLPMGGGQDSTARESIMESVLRGDESEETRKEIIRKSKCLVPTYNKGPVQYVGTVDEAKDAGK